MSNISKLAISALGTAILTAHAFAQTALVGDGRELSADRPDATESPVTVEPGHTQIETNLYDWSRDGSNDTHTWLSIHTKFGLTESMDIGILFDSFVQQENPDLEGFGDIGLTLKWNLWGNDGGDTALALLPMLKIPTGTSVSNNEWEGGLAVPFAMGLANGWSLGLMAAVDVVADDDGGHEFEFLHTAVIGHDLTETVGVFFEYIGVASERHYEASLATGLTYQIHQDLVIDLSVRTGLSSVAPDFGMATGFTIRF